MKDAAGKMELGRNDPCWCGSGKKYKKCHINADSGQAPAQGKLPMSDPAISMHPHLIKTKEQIEGIREAGKLNSEILDMLSERIEPGVTTGEIDQWVHDHTIKAGATPATLGFKGYTKSCCTSVNEVVCHGIPGERLIEKGDILNVDVTSILNGYYGDSSRMFTVGEVSPKARKLIDITRECLDIGIGEVRPGNHVGDIGYAIQQHAQKNGFSVVRDFVGHGIGLDFHEPPQIPHFGKRGKDHPLLPGMVFTIEPMINEGHWGVKILDDGWTAITVDNKLSAQFEHTVTVTSDGVEILTL